MENGEKIIEPQWKMDRKSLSLNGTTMFCEPLYPIKREKTLLSLRLADPPHVKSTELLLKQLRAPIGCAHHRAIMHSNIHTIICNLVRTVKFFFHESSNYSGAGGRGVGWFDLYDKGPGVRGVGWLPEERGLY